MNGIVLRQIRFKHSLFQTERSWWRPCFSLQNQTFDDCLFGWTQLELRAERGVIASGCQVTGVSGTTSAQVGVIVKWWCFEGPGSRPNAGHLTLAKPLALISWHEMQDRNSSGALSCTNCMSAKNISPPPN